MNEICPICHGKLRGEQPLNNRRFYGLVVRAFLRDGEKIEGVLRKVTPKYILIDNISYRIQYIHIYGFNVNGNWYLKEV